MTEGKKGNGISMWLLLFSLNIKERVSLELYLCGSLSCSSIPEAAVAQGSWGVWMGCADGQLAGQAQHRWLMWGGAGHSSVAELPGTAHGHSRTATRAHHECCSELLHLTCTHPLSRGENHIHHGLQKALNTIRVNPSSLSKYTFEGYFIVALIGLF